MHDTGYKMHDAGWGALKSRRIAQPAASLLTLLGPRYSVFGPRRRFGSGAGYRVPGARYPRNPGYFYPASCIPRVRVFEAWARHSARYRVPGPGYQLPGTWYPVPD